jgi:hypothetical protein
MLMAGLLTCSSFACLPGRSSACSDISAGKGLRSLQLRDSSGLTPDSLLIPVMGQGTKALQRYVFAPSNAILEC